MAGRKIYSVLLVALFITNLVGCGASSLQAPASQAKLLSISITSTNSTIAAGTSADFTAVGTYSDNTTKDLTTSGTWVSSDENVASINTLSLTAAAVNAPGHITIFARGIGDTYIKMTWGNVSGWFRLRVTAATLVSLAVTPLDPSIASGTNKQFIATGTFSDNTTQDLTTSVTWSSSTTSIATISNTAGSKGLATSLAAGATTISAALGSVSGSTSLTVTPATLVSLAITPKNPSIVLGTMQQFTATGTYSDNTTQDLTASVIWSSSSTNIATINNGTGSQGAAASLAAGTTTITALSGSISGSTTLTVTAATLVSITVTPVNPSIANGATQLFTATGSFSNNTTQDLTAAVTWSSATTDVATISNAAGSNGLATAVGGGTTIITCASGNVSATTTLTVTGPAAGTGVATLSWDAPTTRADGSSLNPITDIATYKIYYGTASNTYTQVVNVPNPGTTTITQTLNLPAGTYYFVVTDVDTSGQESSYSNEGTKTL